MRGAFRYSYTGRFLIKRFLSFILQVKGHSRARAPALSTLLLPCSVSACLLYFRILSFEIGFFACKLRHKKLKPNFITEVFGQIL